MSNIAENDLLLSSSDVIEDSRSISLQHELIQLREQIKQIRFKSDLETPLRNWELIRLFEVQNILDLEIQKTHEDGLKELVEKLKLEELNASPILQGLVKCTISKKFGKNEKDRSIAFMQREDSFTESNVMENQPNEHMNNDETRKEIINQLLNIEKKQKKNKTDLENRKRLMDILKQQYQRMNSDKSGIL